MSRDLAEQWGLRLDRRTDEISTDCTQRTQYTLSYCGEIRDTIVHNVQTKLNHYKIRQDLETEVGVRIIGMRQCSRG
jgi:hypothetical protein